MIDGNVWRGNEGISCWSSRARCELVDVTLWDQGMFYILQSRVSMELANCTANLQSHQLAHPKVSVSHSMDQLEQHRDKDFTSVR